jgi:carbon-monoxide dehydrogenase small subunit
MDSVTDSVTVSLKVNGKAVRTNVEPDRSLLAFLREDLGLLGTHEGCGRGDCGSCTVLLDGRPALSCIMFAFQADGREVVTIEGISDGERLDAVQKCFIDKGAIQCGFCTPAMILVARSLLDENPTPTRDEIREAISGVLCRCTGYKRIVDAIEAASATGTAGEKGV